MMSRFVRVIALLLLVLSLTRVSHASCDYYSSYLQCEQDANADRDACFSNCSQDESECSSSCFTWACFSYCFTTSYLCEERCRSRHNYQVCNCDMAYCGGYASCGSLGGEGG